MASLKPTFLWRRIETRIPIHRDFTRACAGLLVNDRGQIPTRQDYLRHNICQTDRINYPAGATPPHRQNLLSVALSPSDCLSETENIRVKDLTVKRRRRKAGRNSPAIQNAAFNKYQTPHPIPASARMTRIITANTSSLNFR